jgi:hypothetical protein
VSYKKKEVMMTALDNLWPKGVGYDTYAGYASYEYDSEKDSPGKVCDLIDSWKKTVLDHGFSSHAVKCLSCDPVEKGIHTLVLALDSTPSQFVCRSFNCTVRKIKADIDVDEDPADTCVGLVINGKNLTTGNDFKYHVTVYRRPQIRTSLKHSLT